jgi:Bacterial transcriptional regulator/FAD dependent oxidoreductase
MSQIPGTDVTPVRASSVTSWDLEADVVIAGFGVAGAAAAVEAARSGADVLVLERTGSWGGAAAMAGGFIYLGGGPLLGELHRATGHVVHLAVLGGTDVVCLDKVGDSSIAPITTRVGGRQPAHWTAVGKAILAYCARDARVDLQARRTRHSISTGAQLAIELSRVRAHGVAFEREESLLGFGCVAAHIADPGEAVAAVSVCGPINRMTFDQQLIALVRMTAMTVWRHAEDGPHRVAPTLQPLRPLRPVPPPALQYA